MDFLTPRQWFWGALAATLAFRFWLGAALPITGDEAYFAIWGQRPDLGYYDHPPMVGWMLAPLVALSGAEWILVFWMGFVAERVSAFRIKREILVG